MSVVVLNLPFPPSANNLFVNKAGRGRIRSDRYRAWCTAAGWELQAQRHEMVPGPYELELTFEKKDARRRDIGNLEKGVSDLLVEHRVVEDDCLAQRITLAWGDVKGVHVVVRGVDPLMPFRSIGDVSQKLLVSTAAKMDAAE